RAKVDGREERETLVEARPRDEVEPDAARVRVRRAVRDEDERRAPGSLDLDLLLERRSPLPEQLRPDPEEGDVARPAPVGPAAQPAAPPDELGVEADPRVEPEPSAVHPPEPDPPGRAAGAPLSGPRRIPGQPERAGEDARPASGDEAERHVDLDAVQH